MAIFLVTLLELSSSPPSSLRLEYCIIDISTQASKNCFNNTATATDQFSDNFPKYRYQSRLSSPLSKPQSSDDFINVDTVLKTFSDVENLYTRRKR